MTAIPLVDLKAQHHTIRGEIDSAINRVIANTAFILGPEAAAFEEEFAAFCGAAAAVGCNSGTDALVLALEGLGVGSGDEVITVSMTFMATAEAVSMVGAIPVFVDVCDDTLLMDTTKIEAAITPRTKAIVPVHLFGQMVDMDPLMAIAEAHDLYVVEDAAQAHSARYKGRSAGTMGHAGTFSFYPGKNLGAYGDAGAVITDDSELAIWLRKARNHGRASKYAHDFAARSSRLDGIQAAVLRAKLPHLREWTARRRDIAARYRAAFADQSAIRVVSDRGDGEHVYHLFVIRVDHRDEVLGTLKEQGVGAGVHYPVPLHRQGAYAHLDIGDECLPVSTGVAAEVLSLPLFPEMTGEQVDRVCSAVITAVNDAC